MTTIRSMGVTLVLVTMLLSEAGPRPNVIVILPDDQGAMDAGAYGATDLATPAFDQLAANGVRLTQFYSAAPVCSPSRAGLLTGRYPWRVGVPSNASAPPPEAINDLAESDDKAGLLDSAVTLAEMFSAAGYRTAHIGKWHLGHGARARPRAQGFAYSFGHMGGCIDNFAHFFYWNGPNRHDLWENETRVHRPGYFFPDLIVDQTISFIRQAPDEPFFVYFASNAPHYPYQGDPKWIEHYAELPFPRNIYAAFLSALDERVGRLLAFLDEAGLRDETIVVYQSDNGHSTEARAPTLLELCDIRVPHDSLDGRSLAALLRDADSPSPHESLHWDLGKQWAVRHGPWKLIHNVNATDGPPLADSDRPWFLANIDEDPGELQNQASANPQVVAQLRELHDAMRAVE